MTITLLMGNPCYVVILEAQSESNLGFGRIVVPTKKNSMYILGLSFDYHDSAAALIKDGLIVGAAQEERFSRVKNDPSLPESAISFCLSEGGIGPQALDCVVFYENTILKLDRILRASVQKHPDTRNYFTTAITSWIQKEKFYVKDRIAALLGLPLSRIHSILHHDSHTASAFFCSPFQQATVVTLDGVGEYETGTISFAENNSIQRLASVSLPHSLGLFYSAFTAFLGFRVNEDEYKVMGMAAYGKPAYYKRIRDLFDLYNDGTFSVDQKFFNFLGPGKTPYNEALIDVFGMPREPESSFFEGGFTPGSHERHSDESSMYYADIAASVQKCTEDVILHIVSRAIERTGVSDVCMAGGVALNSLANGRVKRELGCRLYIQPAAGDAGGAMGAALSKYYGIVGRSERPSLIDPFLGQAHDDSDIRKALYQACTGNYEVFPDTTKLLDTVAQLLRDGAVIGWVQGRFEWGPRALGARSIIADPTKPGMKDVINAKIKFREPFRPFAPAVLEERAAEFFDIGEIHSLSDPEYFMLAIAYVYPDKRRLIPAVTHVDGTARVQLVHRQTNQMFYDLIKRFAYYSGVPIILNTSFNLRGEPIVNTPLDAIRTFEWSDMDYLVMGSYLVSKSH